MCAHMLFSMFGEGLRNVVNLEDRLMRQGDTETRRREGGSRRCHGVVTVEAYMYMLP